jgi:predicted nucleic acid-binding protein
MLVYLDTMICVYAVEGPPTFQNRALARLAALHAATDQPAVSDLTWLECRVKPLAASDTKALADIETFLNAPGMARVPMPFAVYDRACQLRATYRFKLGDALHLAAAIEAGCGTFLTNDHRLNACREIPVEVLA